ncbi:MAG: polyamine aminopropyltransferase [Spirochaetes bacterium]|nr:polyamine aminopropyltransferase [Spirochaetota bacterium]
MWFVENQNNVFSLGISIKDTIIEEQSEFQKITLYNTHYFGKLLTLDDLVMLSEKDEFVYHEMICHMPLISHPNPQKVLVVGGGDGGSIREVLKHPEVTEAVLCEIDERVVRICQEYMPSVAGKLSDPKVKLNFEDGFKFLNSFNQYFDVILTDSSDPIGPGENLFKEDYYKLIKKALKPDGIMVSQSETPWFYQETMSSMTESMCKIFKNVETYTAFIPLYPSGFWTFTAASDHCSLKKFDQNRSKKLAESCRYYNPEIHQAALALPNFVKKMVNNQ